MLAREAGLITILPHRHTLAVLTMIIIIQTLADIILSKMTRDTDGGPMIRPDNIVIILRKCQAPAVI